MADWQKWRRMALDPQRGAQVLMAENLLRPCASRLYYAAYQAVTAVLLYRSILPPSDREAWSHDATPGLIVDQWEPYEPRKNKRIDLAKRLTNLYKVRLNADYISETQVDLEAVKIAVRDSNLLIKNMHNILPGEEKS